jgi:hypothetical protein
MTVQGNEAQASPVVDQETVTGTVETPAAAHVDIDPDLKELQDAEAAAKVEEAAAKGQGEPPAAGTAATPAAAAAAPPAVVSDQTDALTIPKPRFDEVNNKLRDAELENARLRGRLEAATPLAPATPAAAPQPTPQDRTLAINAQIDTLAKQFDDGEITLTQYKQQERSFEAQLQAIREEALLAKVPKQQQPAAGDDSLYVHQQTQQVVTEHPWVSVFEQVGTDADWALVRERAQADMKERNVDLSNRAAADLELRKTMGRMMDDLGPVLVATRAQKQGIVLPNGQPQAQATPAATPQKPPLSPAAQARAEKLDLAGNAPPNLAALSGGTDDGGMPSAAAIEMMSDEDIAALPRGVQEKILGLSAA